MNVQDYYAILGVSRDAAPEEIKRAYRKRALDLHPDRNPDRADAEEQFKRLTEAYSVLADPEKRVRYDRFGLAGVRGAGAFSPDPSIFADLFGGGGLGGLESLFEHFFGPGFFGGVAPGTGPRDGADIRAPLTIEFSAAAFGVETEVRIRRSESCGACSGSGAAPGGLATCRTCRGEGRVVARMGFVQIAQACPTCRGRGRVIQERCKTCGGAGRVESEKVVPVRVPGGVEDGARLRVAGGGHGGDPGGRPGDLYIDIDVRPHERFVRKGADVHAALVLGFPDLALGGAFSAPTLHGDAIAEVPPGATPGAEIRLRGKGAARLGRRGFGDHVLHILARPPKRLSAQQKKLWEELRALEREAGEERGDERNFIEKLKDLLSGE